MRALVTGVSGFVGGHLCEHLVAEGDQVVGISASGKFPADVSHLAQVVRIERLDLVEASEDELSDLVRRKQPEVIYHLAAQSNPQQSVSDPRGTWALNLGGTLNLLEAVKASGQKPRVIVVSSGTCYGDPAPEFIPVREDCPVRPNNPYAASKAAADLLAIQHHLAHGTDAVIVRPFNHAGPRQTPRTCSRAWRPRWRRSRRGRRNASRSATSRWSATSSTSATWSAAIGCSSTKGRAGEIYNLGTGRGTKIASALEHLRSLAARPIPVRVDPRASVP